MSESAAPATVMRLYNQERRLTSHLLETVGVLGRAFH
jgi:hypothetical protein